MSPRRRRRKRQKQSRKQYDETKQNKEWEQNILHDAAALNDPDVQAAIANVAQAATNRERLEASLQLQKLIRQDAALLGSSDPELREEVRRLRRNADAMDEAEKEWNQDRHKFVNETIQRAEKHKPVGEEAEREKAKAAKMLRHYIQQAKADKISKQMQLKERLRTMPKRKINVTGKFVGRKVNGQPQKVLEPDVVNIMGIQYVLEPGVQEVPELIAQRYEQMLESREENRKRKELLEGGRMEAGPLEQKMIEIDQQYGTRREPLG